MSDRVIEKNLIGTEDMITASGNQTRDGTVVSLTRISAFSIPFDTDGGIFIGAVVYNIWTSVEFTDITAYVNVTNKYAGLRVFDYTTGKPVWAVGSAAGDIWVDATGATVYTPV